MNPAETASGDTEASALAPNPHRKRPKAARPARHLPPIRLKIAMLVLACVLPAVAMAVALIAHDFRNDRALLQQNTLVTARALVSVVDREISEVHAGLSGLSSSLALRRGELAPFQKQAEEFQPFLALHHIEVTALDGTELVNTLRPFGTASSPKVPALQAPEAIAPGDRVVRDQFVVPVSGEPFISLGVPVVIDGSMKYALSGVITPQRMQDALLRQKLPAGWVASILDASGTIVARVPHSPTFIGRKGGDRLRQLLLTAGEGTFDGVTRDGIPVLTVFSRAPATNWTVAIGIPQADIDARLWDALGWIALGSFALLLASMAAAWWLGGDVARSLSGLVRASVQLGRGEQVELAHTSFAEAERVAAAMSHASVLLNEAHRDIDEKEARLGVLLETAMDAVIVCDELQRIVSFNAAASELFGYFREELLGVPFAVLMAPRFRAGQAVTFFPVEGARRRIGGAVDVVQGLRRDGSQFAIDASISSASISGRYFTTIILREAGGQPGVLRG